MPPQSPSSRKRSELPLTNTGRSPAEAGSGYSAEPEPSCTVSAAVAVSIPNARGDYNAFRDRLTGKLDKLFLRHSAVRRLTERGRISRDRAAELLLCKPAMRRAVVATWFDLAGDRS